MVVVERMTAVIEVATGYFQSSAEKVNGTTYVPVDVPRSPDERTEKWNNGLIAPKTAQEIATYDEAHLQAKAVGVCESPMTTALLGLALELLQRIADQPKATPPTLELCRGRLRELYTIALKARI